MSWGEGKISDLGVRQANSVGAVPGATRTLLGKNTATGKSVVKPVASQTSRISAVVRQSIGDPNSAAWAYLPGLAQHAGLEPTSQPKTQLIEQLMPNQVRYAKGYRERNSTGGNTMKRPEQLWNVAAQTKPVSRSVQGPTPEGLSALKVAGNPCVQTNVCTPMDGLVELWGIATKKMIANPCELTRRNFYRIANEILQTGNRLPVANVTMLKHGLTNDLILKGLVQRKYMTAHQGPNPLQVRAQRVVNWFQAKSSVRGNVPGASLIMRQAHGSNGQGGGISDKANAQYQDCVNIICPDLQPDEDCQECDELLAKSQRQLQSRALIHKTSGGGVPFRSDGRPAVYNSLGVRIR